MVVLLPHSKPNPGDGKKTQKEDIDPKPFLVFSVCLLKHKLIFPLDFWLFWLKVKLLQRA